MKTMPKTNFLAGASMLATLLAAGPLHAETTLSVVTYGGAFENAVQEAYLKPYAKATGTEFSLEAYDGGLAKLAAMVQANNTSWDLIDLESNDAVAGCDEGLLMPLDESILGDTSDFIPGSIGDCAVASMIWSTVFAYDKEALATGPTLISDFFDTDKFPGKRGLRKSPKGTLEWALLADGVSKDKVYDVLATKKGLDRAFRQLDAIKQDIIWWESGAQAPQLLADGAVVMTQAYNGRIHDSVKNDGSAFVTVWDGQIYDYEWWGVPAGAPNAEEAFEFIAYASRADVTSQLSRYISYAPPRKNALPLIEKDILEDLPTADANFKNAVQIDVDFWVDNFDVINKRFQVWLAR
ncbi:polyamine ABC transporter substrate-binding protein [Oceanobacter sp. 2_MG-2023]|jgi:putative spermidine/putrescine transport system substrate-binding protein|uniref:polyamine ABC transporter substrate-binding protein n=2 Tax=unclassified Oceanobacter TaxID=2620260 RepID=UPI0026E3FAB5|nr:MULTISPECIES: polyamine ABC transporter substrate-binding protein [unclassified Oceanobacter]MDO6682344.1 polyamine ABC transporter substrate-binding protein [Oceanobacter sp. 5_MG-2023]MDP2612042.1 polyamine ABC transporter substrate-binding protein [Oceanobacter sp. 2_MG-2023]